MLFDFCRVSAKVGVLPTVGYTVSGLPTASGVDAGRGIIAVKVTTTFSPLCVSSTS